MLHKKSVNRKIQNATNTEYDGIKFKSKLEATIYKVFKDNGFDVQYECETFHLWKGFKPTVPFYIKPKKAKSIIMDNKKIIDITYCPDLCFDYKDYIVFIEIKPDFCNDVYPYKRKLFRRYLEDYADSIDKKIIFAQINTKNTALEFINILKNEY